MIGFPLLLIPLAIYNIIAFLMRDVLFAASLFTLPLPSGTGWPVSLSDVLVSLGILLLLCEVVKGARPGAKYLTDHLLSLLVLCGAAAEFVLLPQFGNSTFFLLTLLALVDFLSGIALRTRRRGAPAEVSPAAARWRERKAAAAPKPGFDTAPAAVPSAPAEAGVAPHAPSPEVPSPGLQPGDGSHPSPDTPR